jgi:uncharacterized repeat protein (TIGR03803 family)
MSNGLKDLGEKWHGCCLAAAIMALPAVPAAGAEKVLHTFQGGSDGISPWGVLVRDKAGNLFGTTAGGGGGTDCFEGTDYGCGTIYRIGPKDTETVVHAFAGGCDGANPYTGLVADKSGNFYGTTSSGGTCNSDQGYGTVYRLAPDGTESVVYAFTGGSDGWGPAGSLTADGKGNLYGMASAGGNGPGCNNIGCGLVFEVTPKGKETLLYNFQGGTDGSLPLGNVIRDAAGNLFGTTNRGGGGDCGGGGCGTVFELAPDGTETILHAFQGGSDGELPQNGVVADGAGNLYGTTEGGGNELVGTVFEVTPAGNESVLYSFTRESGGYYPGSAVIFDKAGNLLGTTEYGGGVGCKQSGGCGTAFMLAPDGTETVLNGFGKRRQGRDPVAGLLLGPHGTLYGTTLDGGTSGYGVVFELKR